MKTRIHELLSSGLFSAIVLLFLFSYDNSYSQSPITITNPATTQVTIPAGATNIIIEVWGAGGSGGSSDKNSPGGGGGGGGGYSRSINILLPELMLFKLALGLFSRL